MTVACEPPCIDGDRVRDWRTIRGLSQSQVARDMTRRGVPTGTRWVKKIESGEETKPRADKLIALCRAIGVEVERVAR